MSSELELTKWLHRLENQPEEAMQRLWQAYYEKLVLFARRRLGSLPRRSADEEDIATSAINSFYQAAQNNRFPKLNDREDLWKILLTITARKASRAVRNQTTQKRGGGAIRGESVFANADSGGGIDLAAAPTQAFGEIFADELLARLDELDDDRLKEIAVKKLEGFTNEEIAQDFGCAVRTVERKLVRIRAAWDESHA